MKYQPGSFIKNKDTSPLDINYWYILKYLIFFVILGVFMDKPGNSFEFLIFPLGDAVRLNLRPPIIMFSGMFLGPLWGVVTGGLVDVLSYNLWYGSQDYLLVLTLLTMFRGFFSGYIFNYYYSKLNYKSVIASIGIPHLMISGLIIPFVLSHYLNIVLIDNIALRLQIQMISLPIYIVVIYKIFSAIKKAKDFKLLHFETERMLCLDELTGLYNRRYFMDYLDKMISMAKRKSSPLSVMMVDLDKFKKINDNYGHNVGDKVIVTIGNILKKGVRNEDIVARIGGEEFAILLPETKLENAVVIAERLKNSIGKKKFSGIERNVTASFGVAQLMKNESQKDLLIRADDALYDSKKGGRNLVSVSN